MTATPVFFEHVKISRPHHPHHTRLIGEQARRWREDGALVMRRFFSATELSDLTEDELLRHPRLQQWLTTVTGDHLEYTGAPTNPHPVYFHTQPLAPGHTGARVWISGLNVPMWGGPVEYVRGSHQALQSIDAPIPEGAEGRIGRALTYAVQGLGLTRCKVPTGTGDLVVFHPGTLVRRNTCRQPGFRIEAVCGEYVGVR